MVDHVDVTVCGHLCLDLLPHMEQVPMQALATPGRLYEIESLDMATGGAVSNTGLALHRLGINVRLMSTVGDDEIGQLIVRTLQAQSAHLADQLAIVPDVPSSYTIVLSPARSDRLFLHCTGTNRTFRSSNFDFEVAARAKIFHLGYPPLLPLLSANDGDELVIVMQNMAERGVVTSMDMTVPDPKGANGLVNWERLLQRTLPYTDIFIPSIEEILFMLRRADFDLWGHQWSAHVDTAYLAGITQQLISMGVSIAGIKLGEYGLFLYTAPQLSTRIQEKLHLGAEWQNQQLWHPAFDVKVAGTTGAGDSAIAGFIANLLQGASPYETVRFAAAVGAHNVEAQDAISGIPSMHAVQTRIDQKWSTRTERLRGF